MCPSTRLSPGFRLLAQRSPPFGSQQQRSDSDRPAWARRPYESRYSRPAGGAGAPAPSPYRPRGRRPSLLRGSVARAALRLHFGYTMCGVSWHPPPRSAAGLLDPCFKTGRTTRASPICTLSDGCCNGAQRLRRTRARPALVLCPPPRRRPVKDGDRGRVRLAPHAPSAGQVNACESCQPPRRLAAHPFPSVHKGRLSRLDWVCFFFFSTACTLYLGLNAPTLPMMGEKGPPAGMPSTQCRVRGSCWHWPPGRDCCRAPGLTRKGIRCGAAVEHRRQPAVHTAPPTSFSRTPRHTENLTCSRLGSPSAPSYFATPARDTERGCDPALLNADSAPHVSLFLPSGSALATSSLLTLFPECFSSFARATCSLSVSGAQYSNCASLGWEFYQPCSDYIPK